MRDLDPVRILLVEDEPDCSDLTIKTLDRAGILNEPRVVQTGKEALSVAEIFHPHVVLLDWVLPDLGGADVLRGIKSVSADTVVIVLSVHIPEQMEAEGCAPDYYISKPIDPVQFMMALKSAGRFGFSIVNLGSVHDHS